MEDQKVIPKIIEKGFLVSPDLKEVKEAEVDDFLKFIDDTYKENKPFVLSKEIYEEFLQVQKKPEIAAQPESKPDVSAQPELKEEPTKMTVIVEPAIERREQIETKVKIKKSYESKNQKISINDWVAYYFDRYNRLRDLLHGREELKNAISIGRVIKSDGRQKVELIGMIKEIHKTFSGAYMIELEDPTGIIKVSLRAPEMIRRGEELVTDEVIGVIGTKSKEIIYAENIIFPEVPEKPLKKAEDEVYAAFISDIHAGSNMFLPKEFSQAISWISGKVGNEEQRAIANKIRYLFIVGDLVDGVGVYPGQENELLIKDIYAQYEECTKYLSQLPPDINIIVLPGNHDAIRIAEPQPKFSKEISEALFTIPNVTMVSNPATVNIHNVGNFPGFDTLLYHGYSLDYYAANVPSLRKTGYDRADLLQEYLLRKRHLAPAHGSTVITPSPHDFLLIDKLPDIFATGHIHYSKVGRYKNILNLCCGCFQDKTSFQEKVGHNPQPGRIPIVNLQTNQVKIMRFR